MPTSIYLKASNSVNDESEKTIPKKNNGNISFGEIFNEPFLMNPASVDNYSQTVPVK